MFTIASVRFAVIPLALCLSAAWAQQQQQQQPAPPVGPAPVEEPRPNQPGLRLNSISVETIGYSLQYPGVTGAPGDASAWFVSSGLASDVAFFYPGRQTQTTLDYQVAYNGNTRFSSLNGFNHAVLFTVRHQPSRRGSVSFGASFESRLASAALFTPNGSERLTQDAISIDEVASGLTGTTALGISPVDLVLFGTRITMGTVNTGFTFNQSPKLTWTGNASIGRVLRGDNANPIVAAQYPSATVATANLGAAFDLSRQTRIAFNGNYMHSESRSYQFDWEFGTADVRRLLGRHAFGHVEAGYGQVVDRGPGGLSRNAYTVATGVGAIFGDHTAVATYRRGGADYRGPNLAVSSSYEASWAWIPLASAWSTVNSFAWEQLATNGLVTGLRVLVVRSTLTRRLTEHTRLVFEGAYVDSATLAPMLLTGGGFRVAYVWTPSIERRRR